MGQAHCLGLCNALVPPSAARLSAPLQSVSRIANTAGGVNLESGECPQFGFIWPIQSNGCCLGDSTTASCKNAIKNLADYACIFKVRGYFDEKFERIPVVFAAVRCATCHWHTWRKPVRVSNTAGKYSRTPHMGCFQFALFTLITQSFYSVALLHKYENLRPLWRLAMQATDLQSGMFLSEIVKRFASISGYLQSLSFT